MNHRFSCRCSLIKMGAVGCKCFLAISGTEARSEQRRALGFHRKEPAPLRNTQKRLFYFHVYHLEADALIKPRTKPPHKTTNSRRTTHSAPAPQSEKLSCRLSSDLLLCFFCVFPVGETSCGVAPPSQRLCGHSTSTGAAKNGQTAQKGFRTGGWNADKETGDNFYLQYHL